MVTQTEFYSYCKKLSRLESKASEARQKLKELEFKFNLAKNIRNVVSKNGYEDKKKMQAHYNRYKQTYNTCMKNYVNAKNELSRFEQLLKNKRIYTRCKHEITSYWEDYY